MAESISRMSGYCSCSRVSEALKVQTQEYPKKKVLTWAVETFYEKCAAFNLRYVPYRTSFDRENCLHNAVKVVIMLVCFLAANFVVLLTILCKLAIHLGGVILEILDWALHASRDSHLKKRLRALISTKTVSESKPAKIDYYYPRVVE